MTADGEKRYTERDVFVFHRPGDEPVPTVETPEEQAGDETIEAADGPVEFQLDLPSFEGPLDLLLELVRSHEIDIFEIPMAVITEEYLACIDRMEELDLDVGGEWLEMATRLVEMKSKSLLPDDEEDEEEEGPDPREELVRRLVEYERFKTYAEKLDDRPTLGDEVFAPPSRLEKYRREVGPPEVEEAGVSDLVDAIRRIVDRTEDDAEEFVYEMEREKLSLRSTMVDIADRLADEPRLRFRELFEGHDVTRNRVVTTFFALLEMTRLEMVSLLQSRLGDSDALYVERTVIDIVEVSQSLDLPEEWSS